MNTTTLQATTTLTDTTIGNYQNESKLLSHSIPGSTKAAVVDPVACCVPTAYVVVVVSVRPVKKHN